MLTVRGLKILYWITLIWIFSLVGITAFLLLNLNLLDTLVGRIVGVVTVLDVAAYILLVVLNRDKIGI